MTSRLPLIRGLHDTVVSSSCLYTGIQILREGDSIAAIEDTENDTLEIGVPKKVYLKIFLEGHSHFDGAYPTANGILKLTQTDLENTYFACLALLITTNDYSTIWRLHEQALWALCHRKGGSWAENDLIFCTALTTSRLDKINKSSMLWHWFRKLSVVFLFENFKTSTFYRFLAQVLRSMEAHFANYAAGYTYIWLIHVARALGKIFDENDVVSLLRAKCRKSLGDISLWTTFGGVLSGRNCVYAERLYWHMAQQIKASANVDEISTCQNPEKWERTSESRAGALVSPDPENTGIDREFTLQNAASSELRWLLHVRCATPSPYTHILQCMKDPEIGKKMIREKLGSVSKGEDTESHRKLVLVLESVLENMDRSVR